MGPDRERFKIREWRTPKLGKNQYAYCKEGGHWAKNMDPGGHRDQTLLMDYPNISGYRSGMGNPFISGDI